MNQECVDFNPEPGTSQTMKNLNDRLLQLGADLDEIERVKRRYPMKISKYYLGLITEKDDPIWRQCVPCKEELEDVINVEDPLKEEDHTPLPYLVHKYPDRVLLLVSSKCSMYCRFCTRKRKVGRIQQIPMSEVFKAIEYISEHPEVRDVVVSGGDPLTLSDRVLETIVAKIRAIPHIEIIRIGTRMPCVNPSRITRRLANMLKKYHPVFMNIHFNHPSEITEESKKACGILADAGIPLGCQTVLLRGVNDSPEIMQDLMKKLLQIRVKPYYIYQCDFVKGVEHFRTPITVGIDIIKHIQGFTSGLCLPHFVIDGPGGKVPLSPQYIKEITPEQTIVTNYLDQLYTYPGPSAKPSKHYMHKRLSRIGIAFNLKKDVPKGERPDRYAECDDIDTIDAIRKAIESDGYETVLLEANENFFDLVKNSSVDFVFNIAEGIHGESRESHVPAILEMLNVPYSGSGVLTQAITLNKSRKKEVLKYYGIPTPKFQVFTSSHQKLRPDFKFPLMVKPDAEGSSVGITNASLVFDQTALKKQVQHVIKTYDQPVLVEEFCAGREFTVSLLGNNKPVVLPIVEVNLDQLPTTMNKIDSYEAKWIFDTPDNPKEMLNCPAELKPRLKAQVERIATKTFTTLGCVDFCRIDMRLDAAGVPNVLDVNALPGLVPDIRANSRFIRSCYAAGMTYTDIILAILNAALKRYNLSVSHQG